MSVTATIQLVAATTSDLSCCPKQLRGTFWQIGEGGSQLLERAWSDATGGGAIENVAGLGVT